MSVVARFAPASGWRRHRGPYRPSVLLISVAIISSGAGQPPVAHAQTPKSQGESARRPSDGPRIKVAPEEINLGKVQVGKPVRASFTITNAGNRPLKFTESPYIEVKAGCCPPVVMLGAWALKPGEHTTVSMQFVMVGKKQGPYDYRVHLPTNDPIQPDRIVAVLSNWVP
jgi:hypothetical protein